MFRKFDVWTFNVWSVRSSVLWCSFQNYIAVICKKKIIHVLEFLRASGEKMFAKTVANLGYLKIPIAAGSPPGDHFSDFSELLVLEFRKN